MVRPSCQLDMAHGSFCRWIPQVVPHRIAADGLKCRRGHKTMGIFAHQYLNIRTSLDELAHKHWRFVGGNSASDSQQNILT